MRKTAMMKLTRAQEKVSDMFEYDELEVDQGKDEDDLKFSEEEE